MRNRRDIIEKMFIVIIFLLITSPLIGWCKQQIVKNIPSNNILWDESEDRADPRLSPGQWRLSIPSHEHTVVLPVMGDQAGLAKATDLLVNWQRSPLSGTAYTPHRILRILFTLIHFLYKYLLLCYICWNKIRKEYRWGYTPSKSVSRNVVSLIPYSFRFFTDNT